MSETKNSGEYNDKREYFSLLPEGSSDYSNATASFKGIENISVEAALASIEPVGV